MDEIDNLVEAALADARKLPLKKLASMPMLKTASIKTKPVSEMEKIASELEMVASDEEQAEAAATKVAEEKAHMQLMKLAKVAVIIDAFALLEKNGGLARFMGKTTGAIKNLNKTIPAAVAKSRQEFHQGLKGVKSPTERLTGKLTQEAEKSREVVQHAATKAELREQIKNVRSDTKNAINSVHNPGVSGAIRKHKVPLAIGAGMVGGAYLASKDKKKK